MNKSTLFDVSQTKDQKLRLILYKKDGSKQEIFVDHIIDASGSEPNVEIARKSGFELDKVGTLCNLLLSLLATPFRRMEALLSTQKCVCVQIFLQRVMSAPSSI